MRLWDETMKTAKLIAGKGRVALKAIKNCIDRGFDVDLKTGQFMEADGFAMCIGKPGWQGRNDGILREKKTGV